MSLANIDLVTERNVVARRKRSQKYKEEPDTGYGFRGCHHNYLTERAPTIKHHVILYHRRITIHFSIVFLRPVSSLFSCCYCCCSLTISKSAIVSHDCGDGCWVVLPLRCKQMKAIRLKEQQQLSDRRRRQLSDKLPPRRRVKVSNTDGKYCRPGDHEEQVGAFPRQD